MSAAAWHGDEITPGRAFWRVMQVGEKAGRPVFRTRRVVEDFAAAVAREEFRAARKRKGVK